MLLPSLPGLGTAIEPLATPRTGVRGYCMSSLSGLKSELTCVETNALRGRG